MMVSFLKWDAGPVMGPVIRHSIRAPGVRGKARRNGPFSVYRRISGRSRMSSTPRISG